MQRDSLPPSTTKISANNAKRGIADADVFLAAGFPEGPLPFPAIARCWKAFVRRRRSIDDFERGMVQTGESLSQIKDLVPSRQLTMLPEDASR